MTLLSQEPLAVDEVSTIDAETFRHAYVNRHRPLIVRGGVDHWPARSWTDETLPPKLGHTALSVHVTPKDASGHLDLDQTEGETMLAPELLTRFEQPGPQCYVHDLNLPPALHPDVGTHPLTEVFPVYRRRTLWWGTDGQVSRLHYDDNENLMAQLAGEKEFLLFEPLDFPYMYPMESPEYHSSIDLTRTAAQDVPLFAQATPYRAVIHPGDLLYVPCYWWHHVTSRGRHMAISTLINETMEQRVRVAGRLIEAGVLPVSASERADLLAIVASDERPSRKNARLKRYHRAYVAEHGHSYYPHSLFHRLIEESLFGIVQGHARY